MPLAFLRSSLEQAIQLHSLYHVPIQVLQHKFNLSRADAQHVVLSCPHCAAFLHPPHVGVNPCRLHPLQLWQMDVTYIPEFGNICYVHVSVDKCSGIIHASPLSGEKTKNVISHCLEAWAAWGKPTCIKTDNGPAYTAASFISFCKQMQVSLNHGLPYNPQGQGIVERAHRTLKECLQKQKEGIGYSRTPKDHLVLALFTLNFLHLDSENRSAADRHQNFQPKKYDDVRWKDVLTGQWLGPDPVIARSRGTVCVFPQDRQDPIWIPERLMRRVLQGHKNEDLDVDPDADPPPATRDDSPRRNSLGNCQSLADPSPNP